MANPVPAATTARRARTIRAGAAQSLIGPLCALPYVLATWGGPHRPALLALIGVMVLVGALIRAAAPRVAGSAARVPVQVAASVLNLGAASLAGVLDGGVLSPLGAWVLFALLSFAIVTPLRAFVLLAAVCVAGYAWVTLDGPAPRPGYVEVHLLGTLAISALAFRHAASLATLRRRLADVTRADPLTRCLNRRGFEERLDAVLGPQRTGPVTLVLVDLDRFKEVNDTFGHRAGDGLLTWTAQTLGRDLGPGDAVGRLGGDEFAVLLTGTPAADAAAASERLRAAVTGTAPSSFGHATYPDDAASAGELRHLADVRLYADKVSRERTLPAPEAIARATAGTAASRPAEVSRRERRRKAMADMGTLVMVQNAIGLLYVAAFMGGSPHRLATTLIFCGGFALGAAELAAAERLSHLGHLRTLLLATAGGHVLVPFSSAILDGGLWSPLVLGLLLPMPLVALASPPRSALPVMALLGGLYVAVGVVAGSPGGWFVVMRLAGIGAAVAACALLGREAASRRVQLMRLSRVDVLTECLNRRGFEERFETELARAPHDDADGLSLLILDLDGFKTLNDTHGHAAGDELLRWVATTLRGEVGPGDAVGRLGGDEFVVLLPSTTPDAARATADRLVAALNARTRVSVGLAALPRHGTSFEALYHHADGELYAEKSRRGSRRRTPPVQARRHISRLPVIR